MKKFSTFQAYAKLWPEYKFCFIGDNGQADVLVSEYIMKHYPDRAAACFIHQVCPVSKTLTSLRKPTVESWAERRIFFFGSYIGAAFAAHQAGLLSLSDVAEIARDAVGDYEAEYSKRRFLNFMVVSRHAKVDRLSTPSDPDSPRSSHVSEDTAADVTVLKQMQGDLQKVNALLKENSMEEIRLAGVNDAERLRRYTSLPPDTNWSRTDWWDLEDEAEFVPDEADSPSKSIAEIEVEMADRGLTNLRDLRSRQIDEMAEVDEDNSTKVEALLPLIGQEDAV